jgi:hypothetical protein
VRLAEAASLRYARLVLQLPDSGEELEMDLLKEALEPKVGNGSDNTRGKRPGSVARRHCGLEGARLAFVVSPAASRARAPFPETLDATKSAYCDSVIHEKRVTVKM